MLLFFKTSFGQGRVVINEFMAWSGCSTTSEYIELLNFGPGPMNIGCYIVTNGKYSVTIPPNTIVQPGQYFVLSGQDLLPQSCGNRDSAVHVDLNWNTCNCTNTPVPTTGNGLMEDGGSANEKVVLLDPNLNVIDAVSRKLPVSSSVSMTTPSLSGGCSSKTFDLSSMDVSYEIIGNSTGVDNSFSRKVDGDCGWVKTPAISAHAPNNTGSSSSASYDFSTLSASDCDGTGGSISIGVTATDVNALFPMNYTLAFDADGNDSFDETDQYLYGIDSSAPSIDIRNLAYGRYRITVGSSSSCNLKSYDFFIFNCYGVVLPLKLLYFRYEGIQLNQHVFRFRVDDPSSLHDVVLEAENGAGFKAVATVYGPFDKNELLLYTSLSSSTRYRLRLTNQAGLISWSPIITVNTSGAGVQYWPNPVKEEVFVRINAGAGGQVGYSVYNSAGIVVKKAALELNSGTQVFAIPAHDLSPGVYYCTVAGAALGQPVFFRFLK